MNKKEFQDAFAIADSDADLSEIDDTVLHGLYTKDFNYPVITTLQVVARMMRHVALYIFSKPNGPKWDAEELNAFAKVARKRIIIAG